MTTKAEDKPTILSKRKSIQTVIDYCLDNKIAFQANPRPISNDEWEVELEISSIKQAIALGMFVREFKLELYGMGMAEGNATTKPKQNGKKAEAKELISLVAEKEEDSQAIETPATLSFDLNANSN